MGINLLTTPFKHQIEAVDYVDKYRAFALYMDMGTGKTRTIIEYVKRHSIKKVVYFCPVFLKKTVEAELKKHIENPSYFVEGGERVFPDDRQFYIVGILSINSDRVYLAMHKLMESMGEYIVVVDESSFIKTFTAQCTTRIITLTKTAKYKAVMTGTPITQYYQDLYAQFKFLDPSIIPYRSYTGFCNRYLKYDSKYVSNVVGSKNIKELMRYVSPYIFSIKKEDCVSIPSKIHKNYYYNMSYTTRVLYNDTKNKYLDIIDRLEYVPSTLIFRLLSELQKIVSSEAVERLKMLSNIRATLGNTRVCVVCKYLFEIADIKNKYPNAYVYTGNQNVDERAKIIERVNTDESAMLLMTYGVGSYGLNLASINQCILYSSVFKYGQRIQVEDRFHRIGQDKHATYHNVICDNSVDVKIQTNLEAKSSIADSFIKEIKNKSALKAMIKDL